MNTLIHTPTNRLDQSIDFYTRLDFHHITNVKAQLFSDGQVLVEINPDRYARAGVKLFKASWKTEVEELGKLTSVLAIGGGFLLSDPNGVRIYLMEGASTFGMEDLSRIKPSILGKFAGISLEATDVGRSTAIWEAVGFSPGSGSIEQGWISLQNQDGMTISIMQSNMCPHLFFNPSLTYFNGKVNNPIVIQKVREAGIPIAEEITHFNKEGIVDNIIIRDPGGYGFFIFND